MNTTSNAIIAPMVAADYVLTPDVFIYVEAEDGSNMSTITLLIPGDNPYIIRFNRNTEKFHRTGIKETQAHFNAFMKRIISMTPAWSPESDPEKVIFNTLKSIQYLSGRGFTFHIDRNFTPGGEDGFPIKPIRISQHAPARVNMRVDDIEFVHPPYSPSHTLAVIDFTLDVVINEAFYPASYNHGKYSLIAQAGHSFNGTVKVLLSEESSFIHFTDTKVNCLPIMKEIFGVRDVDIHAFIVRALASGYFFFNDGQDTSDLIKLHSYNYSTLMEAMEKYGKDIRARLDKLDNKKSSAA